MTGGAVSGDKRLPSVFLSYTQTDKAWAEWIAWQLEGEGYPITIQAWHSVGGTHFLDWMDRSLATADHVVVVLSPDYLRSAYGGVEWQRALGKDPTGLKRVLVPVMVRPCQLEGLGLLADIAHLNLVGLDEGAARATLVDGLHATVTGDGRPTHPPPFPVPAGSSAGSATPASSAGSATPASSAGAVRAPTYPGTGRPPENDLLDLVEKACHTRYPGAVTERAEAGHLEVAWEDDGEPLRWPVGVFAHGLDRAGLDAFVGGAHAEFERFDPRVRSEIVYVGELADEALVRAARRRSVRVYSLTEYARRWDPRRYLERQSERLLADPIYPPSLYLPQRYVLLDDPARPTLDDVFAATVDWLDAEPARLVLVLGEFGHGKTFLLRELARRLPDILPNLVPVLIRLGALEKHHSLDVLLASHLATAGESDWPGVRRMLERGQVVLLFDGFDELALRTTFDRATEHLRTILSALTGQAKVVLTSRRQHFTSDDQLRTAMGDEVALIAGSRLLRLADFDDGQIHEFLVRLFDLRLAAELPDEAERRAAATARAEARLALIRDVKDLLGLSRNPRMLSFIADLDEQELRAAQADRGEITSADLYRKLVRTWLDFEVARRHGTGLSAEQLDRAATILALRLWQSSEHGVDVAALEEAARVALTEVAGPGAGAAVTPGASGASGRGRLDPAQAAFAVGSSSLLVRTEDDLFGFVHSSVMEYLVAAEAARLLAAGQDRPDPLAAREMSRLMADFFAGCAGAEPAAAWARAVLDDEASPAPARANALAVAARLDARTSRSKLAGQDLRDQDLTNRDLRGSDLTAANLVGMRLSGTILAGAKLAGAAVTDAVLDAVDLTGADLTDADLRGTRLLSPTLVDVELAGSRWERTAIIGAGPGFDATAYPELTPAAISGRDPVALTLMPGGEPAAAAFSPDGELLAVAWGNAVVLADCRSRRPVRVLTGPDGPVRLVAYSPDGTLLAAGGDDGTVRLWDAATAEPRAVLVEQGPVRAMAFSPDGARLATAVGGIARVWGIRDGEFRLVVALPGRAAPVTALAFSPDGAVLASASGGTVRLSDATTGTQRHRLPGGSPALSQLAFSPDGQYVAAGGEDGGGCLWTAESGQLARTFDGDGNILGLAFSPDSGEVIVHKATDLPAYDPAPRVRRARFVAADGVRAMARGYHDGVEVDAGSSPTWSLTAPEPVRGLAYSPDGELIASRGENLVAWGPGAGPYRLDWDGRTFAGRIRALVVGAGGDVVVAAATAMVLGGGGWSRLGQEDPGGSVAVSRDGRLAAAGCDDGTVRVWAVEPGGAQRAALAGHRAAVTPVAFHPAGQLLASGDENGARFVWDLASRSPVHTFAHHGPVRGLRFSPDGRMLAVGDGTGVRLRSVEAWSIAALAGDGAGDGAGAVNALAFAPGGDLLAVAGDRGAYLWRDGRVTHRLREHLGPVLSVAVAPDGREVATGGEDGTTRLWDAATGRHLATVVARPAGWDWAALFPDGTYTGQGDMFDAFWWAAKLHRFGPDAVAAFDPAVRHRPDATIRPPR